MTVTGETPPRPAGVGRSLRHSSVLKYPGVRGSAPAGFFKRRM